MVNANFGPDVALAQRLSAIERRLNMLATSPILLNASTGQTPGVPGLATDINGLHLFDANGNEDVTLSTADGSATFAGNMNVTGNSTFGGSMVINGNLSVPNGSITNAALSAPVFPLTAHADISGFNLATGANATILSKTISVPSGYSQALVMVVATITATNPTASTDTLYMGATINGSSVGWSSETDVAANSGTGCLASAASALLTGLGASFVINAQASTLKANWANNSNTPNNANLDATVLFLR